jgi:MarR family transcriptional regulator, lower aerobic nicotinate degradation pathway regulator
MDIERTKVVWKRPGFLARRLHQIHVAIFLAECAGEQVTPIQWGILTIVRQCPGIGQVELAEELGLDRSNIANVVDRLVRRGVLLQTVSKLDRRKRSIAVTPKGLKLLARFEPKAERAQSRVLEALSVNERKVFMSLLSRVVERNNGLSRAPIRIDE